MSYLPEGWQPEPPFIFSYGDYKLGTGSNAYLGVPLKYSNKDTADGNKAVVNAYTSTGGIDPVVGLPYHNMLASGNALYNERLGGNDVTRDIRLYHQAICDMFYVTGAQPLPPHSAIAPAVGGFQEWKPGMVKIGYSLESQIYTGTYGHVFFDALMSHGNLKLMTETVTIDVSGSLSNVPVSVNFAYGSGSASGAKAYFVIPSGYAEAVRDVSVKYNATSGTNVLRVAATDGASSMTVQYWYL